MVFSKSFLDASDNHRIPVYHWSIERPKGAVLILHGMAEHGGRYQRLAQCLNTSGYSVMAIDHRGHGPETPPTKLGIFAQERGWERVLDDVSCSFEHLRTTCPGIPLFVLGHSMGSFITQAWLMLKPDHVCGAILSGSNYAPRPLLQLGRGVTFLESLRIGREGRSKVVDTLTFGSYNNAFKPVRTTFDWLSRDPVEVDKYIADPHCGFQCSNSLWLDLFQGLLAVTSLNALKKIDSRLPLYITGGDKDPVGRFGKGLRLLAKKLSMAGITDITTDLWPDGRHEMFNECNRDDVTARLLTWLEQHTPERSKQQTQPDISAAHPEI